MPVKTVIVSDYGIMVKKKKKTLRRQTVIQSHVWDELINGGGHMVHG